MAELRSKFGSPSPKPVALTHLMWASPPGSKLLGVSRTPHNFFIRCVYMISAALSSSHVLGFLPPTKSAGNAEPRRRACAGGSSVYIKLHIPAPGRNVSCPSFDSIRQCLFAIIGAWTAIFKPGFSCEKAQTQTEFDLLEKVNPPDYGRRKRNVSHSNYSWTPLSPVPAP